MAITRPALHAEDTAAALSIRGYQPRLTPLMTVQPLFDGGPVERTAVLAFTSRTAPRLLAPRSDLHDRTVFAVGDATAGEAQRAGFQHVVSADGDVRALAEMLIAERAEPVVHFSGADQSGDLAQWLADVGLRAERRVIYKTVPAERLPDEPTDVVLLYSPNTAKLFAELAAGTVWDDVACVVISERAAEPLGTRRVAVAQQPSEAAMFAALDRLVG